mgnify:CR=1 FL=1
MPPKTDQKTEIELLREQKLQLELDIAHLQNHDPLTGLMNRNAFMQAMDEAILELAAIDGQAALIEVGIRGLPHISGTLSRHASDYMISSLAARLRLCLPRGAMACRLDYWSFAVFIPKAISALEVLTIAKNVITALGEPVDWVDRKLALEVTAGVALSTPEDCDAITLLHNAGLALKSAMEKDGAGYAFFNPALAQAAKRRADIEQFTAEGMEKGWFELNYQPVYDAISGRLAGFEALLRLRHPEQGIIPPLEFIPVAEESGMIQKIGAWVLSEACREAAHWPDHLTVAVNISPEQFYSSTLITDVHRALERSGLPPQRLEIEITESTLLKDSDMVLGQLDALRDMGCPIVLDDFGTGYSSLSYLWKFPFSKLKMDKSFAMALEDSPLVPGMIHSIIDLARHLGLKVTAEGVETDAQLRLLRSYRCDLIQGFLCGRPTALSDVPATILRNVASEITRLPGPGDSAGFASI